MMKTILRTGMIASLVAGALASCSNDDAAPVPLAGEFVQISFRAGDDASTRAAWTDPKGSGSLIFGWEEDTEGKELVATFTDGSAFLGGYSTSAPVEGDQPQHYTYLTIAPKEDAHYADFKTVQYFSKDDETKVARVHAVTPVGAGNVTASGDAFKATLSMPGEFTQTASQQPEFLSDYMMMYGSAAYTNGSASIDFCHMAATFRFIITNQSASPVALTGVKVSVDGEGDVASQHVTLSANAEDDQLTPVFGNDGRHAAVTTWTTGEDVTLAAKDGVYTAYAMVLPLGDAKAFENKTLKIAVGMKDLVDEWVTFELKGSRLAEVNGDGVHDWVGGKSYTFRMNFNDVLTLTDLTIADWKDVYGSGEMQPEF